MSHYAMYDLRATTAGHPTGQHEGGWFTLPGPGQRRHLTSFAVPGAEHVTLVLTAVATAPAAEPANVIPAVW